MQILSKKNILISSLILSVFGLVLGKISDQGSCGEFDPCLWAAYPLLAFIPVLVFSLIIYFIKEEVFVLWKRVTSWWATITVILVMLSPTEHADLIGFEKKSVLFILSIFYTLISLILIAYKSYKLRGR